MPSLCGQGQGYLFKVVGNYVLKVGGGGCLPAQHSPLQLRNNTSYPGMSDSNFSPCQYSLQPCNIQVDCKRYFPHLVFPAPTKISVTFSVSYATSLFTVKLFMFKKPLGPPPCLRTIKARRWHDLEHGGGDIPTPTIPFQPLKERHIFITNWTQFNCRATKQHSITVTKCHTYIS